MSLEQFAGCTAGCRGPRTVQSATKDTFVWSRPRDFFLLLGVVYKFALSLLFIMMQTKNCRFQKIDRFGGVFGIIIMLYSCYFSFLYSKGGWFFGSTDPLITTRLLKTLLTTKCKLKTDCQHCCRDAACVAAVPPPNLIGWLPATHYNLQCSRMKKCS